jgi:uroporphyrin-III C-methyltransferase/precorrin-2 dehydrogenase/sirohydrochlorin ferrochelatase
VAHEFTVLSGHIAPDHPDSLVDWSALGRMRGTLVMLMAVDKLPAIAERLIAEGRRADTPAAVIADGSTADQRSVRAPLSEIAATVADAGIRPPAIVVIGDVVALTSPEG